MFLTLHVSPRYKNGAKTGEFSLRFRLSIRELRFSPGSQFCQNPPSLLADDAADPRLRLANISNRYLVNIAMNYSMEHPDLHEKSIKPFLIR